MSTVDLESKWLRMMMMMMMMMTYLCCRNFGSVSLVLVEITYLYGWCVTIMTFVRTFSKAPEQGHMIHGREEFLVDFRETQRPNFKSFFRS